ncbi:odorant receptor 22c-like isoform X2 [Venturia canescens]|uniref:odorant receptor 22c-like isoform X2 n=1 Tax=Venturia canescens TaxID=32260 RepID=UPI001C9CA18E|nr:odorant receptor 22c-like isoform X2 [Venturia canescens]
MSALENNERSTVSEKISNNNYESDIKYMLRYTKRLLEILGIWQMVTNDTSLKSKLLSRISVILCLVSMAFLLVPTGLHISLRVRDFASARVSLGYFSPCVASVLKYAFIIYHSKNIKFCLKHMESDWMNVVGHHDRTIMIKNVKVEHVITAASGLLLYSGGVFLHAVMPLIKGPSLNSRNETIRPIVYPGYDFFLDPQITPTYEIIFCTICFSAFIRFTVTLTAVNLTALFVNHTCGQAQIVVSRLEKLFDHINNDATNEREIERRISFLVLRHVRGLRLSTIIDQILKEICLVEVVTATLILCLLEYYVVEWKSLGVSQTVTFSLLLVSYTYNIYMFCYIGELLKDQFQQVGKAAYMIEWYRIPKKNKLSMILIIAIANYPARKVTAGGLIELSINTFGVIMKTSIVYQNMLRTFSQAAD